MVQTTLLLNIQCAFGGTILEHSAHVFHEFTIVKVDADGTLQFI